MNRCAHLLVNAYTSTSTILGNSGERFPTCDPQKKAVLEPRPQGRKEFLHGILQVRLQTLEGDWEGLAVADRRLCVLAPQPQGIARVEREGYDILKVCRRTVAIHRPHDHRHRYAHALTDAQPTHGHIGAGRGPPSAGADGGRRLQEPHVDAHAGAHPRGKMTVHTFWRCTLPCLPSSYTSIHQQVPTARADETDAAYGAALLALKTLEAAKQQAAQP